MHQSSTNITIREATVDDAAEAAKVFNAAFAPLRSIYRPTDDAVNHQVERAKEETRLVAKIENRLVGTVQFDSHEKHVHVIGLAVHPDYQRMGVARSMIEYIVARSRAIGHGAVMLDTIKETGNIPLFEKMGFHVVHEQLATWCVSDNDERLHDVKMERRIA